VTLALVLIVVVLALLLAVWQPLRLSLVWGPDGRAIRLRYLMIQLRSDRRRSSDGEAAAPGEREAGKKREKRQKRSGRKRWRFSWRRLIALLPEAAVAVWKSGAFLVGRCRIDHLRIEGPIGTSDPALTGVLWGAVSAVQGAILTQGVGQSRLWPEFIEGRTAITFDATLSVPAGSLLATPLVLVWHLPKRKLWRAFRSARSSVKRNGPVPTGISGEGEEQP
jgi:hypothetical protein